MPVHDYAAFWTSLKRGSLESGYYFYGIEDVLKDEALSALIDRALDPAARDFDLDQRSASQIAPEDLVTLCTTLPMMAERRVVVIRDLEAWSRKAKVRAAAIGILEAPAPETILVLIQGSGAPEPDAELAARCHAVEFGRLRPDHAARWLARRAGERGVALHPDAADHLLAAAEGDLGLVNAELGKLTGLAGNGPVTVAQVEALVGVRRGETQFDWRDAVLADRADRALDMLPHVLAQQGVTGVKLVSLLGMSLAGLALARRHYDGGVRGGRLESAIIDGLRRARVWGLDYRSSARAWADWAPRWPRPRVRNALRSALAADQALKATTISDEAGILTDLIVSLATSDREAA